MAQDLVVGIFPSSDPQALESALAAQNVDLTKVKVVSPPFATMQPRPHSSTSSTSSPTWRTTSLSDDMTRGMGIMGDSGRNRRAGTRRTASESGVVYAPRKRVAAISLGLSDSAGRSRQLRRRHQRRPLRRSLPRRRRRPAGGRDGVPSRRPAQRSHVLRNRRRRNTLARVDLDARGLHAEPHITTTRISPPDITGAPFTIGQRTLWCITDRIR